MDCRRCGACCIAGSISSSIPGMPGGKPAGEACVHLRPDRLCALYGLPGRPLVCSEFSPTPDACGSSFEEAMALLREMERQTAPGALED